MSEHPSYCLERAREHREAADATPLVNVRQKHIQSAEMWERMAQRNSVLTRHVDQPSEEEAVE